MTALSAYFKLGKRCTIACVPEGKSEIQVFPG